MLLTDLEAVQEVLLLACCGKGFEKRRVRFLDLANARVELLIDVVAQSRHYKLNATSLQNDFVVEGEHHY
jgi:hypothetical protein